MAKNKNRQITVQKTQQRKLKPKQHEPHQKQYPFCKYLRFFIGKE